MKWTIWVLAVSLLTGCATGPSPRHARSEPVSSGMNRTVVTRDHGGPIHEKIEPIVVENDHHSLVDPLPCTIPVTPPPPPTLAVAQETHDTSPDSRSLGMGLGYQRLRIWNKLTTEFNSPNFSRVAWNHTPTLRGEGLTGSIFWGEPGESGAVFEFSHFWDERTANAQSEGNLYVKETLHTEGLFMNLEGRYYPAPWVFGSVGAGLLVYQARSTIDTNAPTFIYHGIEGTRVLVGFDFGGGFETPWNFPVHLFLTGRLFGPISDEEPILESAIGQTTAGILIRF